MPTIIVNTYVPIILYHTKYSRDATLMVLQRIPNLQMYICELYNLMLVIYPVLVCKCQLGNVIVKIGPSNI